VAGFMTLAQFPATGRFTRRFKREVLRAIARGDISISEAAILYDLSVEELNDWTKTHAAHGIEGLRATFQRLRRKAEIGRVYRWARQADGSLVRTPERQWRRAKLDRAA
jgi:transposase-like protein